MKEKPTLVRLQLKVMSKLVQLHNPLGAKSLKSNFSLKSKYILYHTGHRSLGNYHHWLKVLIKIALTKIRFLLEMKIHTQMITTGKLSLSLFEAIFKKCSKTRRKSMLVTEL